MVDSDFTVQGGYYSCSKLLNGFEATALFAANDLMAIGAIHYAYDRQIPVPAALSVVGFDDITFAQFTQPALTTVAVPRAEIGRLAFQSLWKLINDSTSERVRLHDEDHSRDPPNHCPAAVVPWRCGNGGEINAKSLDVLLSVSAAHPRRG